MIIKFECPEPDSIKQGPDTFKSQQDAEFTVSQRMAQLGLCAKKGSRGFNFAILTYKMSRLIGFVKCYMHCCQDEPTESFRKRFNDYALIDTKPIVQGKL